MKVKEARMRKFVNKKIMELHNIIADLDGLVSELGHDYFRVCIFGSARIKSDSFYYRQAFELAYNLANRGCDIVTGGGPGLMEAANAGAKKAGNSSRSYGLAIKLPFESDANSHLDVEYQHQRFSSRLDEFMRMSQAVVMTPGGIGTLLELFYTWQLIQVQHISKRPIYLLGEAYWRGILEWLQEVPLQEGLFDQKDMSNLVICSDVEDVIKHMTPLIEAFAAEKQAKGTGKGGSNSADNALENP